MQQGALSEVGRLSRGLRIAKGYTMADQSDALDCTLSQISQFETGRAKPSNFYISAFVKWIGVDMIVHQSLLKSAKETANVIDLDSARSKQKRLYRKLNSLSPSQVRALRGKGTVDDGGGKPNDR